MDFDNHPIVLAVRSHLMQSFGQPEQVQVMQGSSAPDIIPQLHVAQFAPEGPSSPNVFATCGSALYQMEDGRRVEGLMIARRDPPDEEKQGMLRMLGRFALFPATQKAVFNVGDLIDAKQDLSSFCDMDTILMLPPLPFVESFRSFESKEGRIDMLWLVPVFAGEAEYARTHGIPAMLNLVSAQNLDLSEPRREEANTLMAPEEAEQMAQERAKEAAEQAKNAGPSLRSVAKLKTNRKDVGKGSFDVEESSTSVKISRRSGAPKSSAKPAPAGPAAPGGRTAPPSGAIGLTPGTPQAKAPGPPRSGPPPHQPLPGVVVKGGSGPGSTGCRQPVRFDLSQGAAGSSVKPQKAAAPPARKKEPPRQLTPEEQEAERQKRIEALKEAARSADERAKARWSEGPDESDPSSQGSS
jgi:hypothetical protein